MLSFKVGQEVRIIKDSNGHRAIGSIVTITQRRNHGNADKYSLYNTTGNLDKLIRSYDMELV